MIRMTRLADYGILLLTLFARERGQKTRSARDLAAESKLPLPTVSKLLKVLARHGLLDAHRGVKGGFALARAPEAITVADIIGALDGPIGVTDCSTDEGCCDIEQSCVVKRNWRRINHVVLDALRGITLAEMARPLDVGVHPVERRRAVMTEQP
jgi:FeS assembly SUF system regulator